MASDRLEKARLWVELTGGLAVLLGLVFVGLELRQNTAAMQAATFQELVHASSEFQLAIATSPEVREVYMTGWRAPESLDEIERDTFVLLQSAYWVRMQNAYMQWRRGALTDDDWQVYEAMMCGSAVSPGGVAHWPQDGNLTQGYREYLGTCSD